MKVNRAPRWTGWAIAFVYFCQTGSTRAEFIYSITDGAAELTVGVDHNEDMVWMNTFSVDPGGQYVDSISVAFGRVGGPSSLDGLPVSILLYEDMNGGSPQDAELKWSLETLVANGNTNVLNEYEIPSIFIQGTLVAAVLYQNTSGVAKYIGALDTTTPSFAERSYLGFAASVDPADLEAIPSSQWGTIESFGLVGNFRHEAHGSAIPEPSLTGAVLALACLWTQHQKRHDRTGAWEAATPA